MVSIRRTKICRSEARCALWIAACFSLISAVYLSWVYHLVELNAGPAADWLTLVLGYICQAAGLALVCHAWRAGHGNSRRQWFVITLLLFAALSAPTILGSSLIGAAGFGLLMNIACGVITGLYLEGLADMDSSEHASLVFGAGYAAGTFATGALAVPGNGILLRGSGMLLICLVSSLCLALAARRSGFFDGQTEENTAASTPAELPGKTFLLACAAILVSSMVKNLGFTFPSSDIAAGLRPELSRLPYGIGLLAAGWINNRSRKNGIICAIVGLAIPFIMLSVRNDPIPEVVLWGLEYLFFSFFTVMRVMLFIDIAHRTHRWELVPVGLLMGRLGDAAGTAVSLLLGSRSLPLITVTFLCFSAAVALLLYVCQTLYEPQAAERKSEQEVFETFCLRHDLSIRERDILRMILNNCTNAEIAEGLFISENTVKYHVRNVLQKTGCKNRVELQKKFRLALYPDMRETM